MTQQSQEQSSLLVIIYFIVYSILQVFSVLIVK